MNKSTVRKCIKPFRYSDSLDYADNNGVNESYVLKRWSVEK
jgi:hypothetical protein